LQASGFTGSIRNYWQNMKILSIHSYYQQRGGEDAVFEAEARALRTAGHEVEMLTLQNADYTKKSKWLQLCSMFWNGETYRRTAKAIKQFKPQVVHVHNLFPFMSPSVLWAAKRSGVPVVVTLHNYRLACANGLFFRAGNACEQCVTKMIPWPAVVHGCYRGSRLQSALIAASMVLHRSIGSWDIPRTFIAPTQFVAEKLSTTIAKHKIRVKPHFAEEISFTPQPKNGRAIFVGRLSEEKGIAWLLDAWNALKTDMHLDVVGEGDIASDDPRIVFHGYVKPQPLRAMISQSSVTIIPSRCYETFSNVVVESFAAGTAVLAAEGTAPASLIEAGKTGAVFTPENFHQLLEAYADISYAETQGKNARAAYLEQYQADRNVEMLLEIYSSDSRNSDFSTPGKFCTKAEH
jgi:glycosyltransferase involved in cell wall biosynthesis